MSDERDREYWFTLERRTSDNESKVAQLLRDYQRDTTQLSHEVKQISDRVNLGLSNSVHAVEVDNVKIQLAYSELKNQLEKSVQEMRGFVTNSTELTKLMVSNFSEKDLKPVISEMDLMKKTFVYGVIGAIVVFTGVKGIGNVWDRFFSKSPVAATQPVAQTK